MKGVGLFFRRGMAQAMDVPIPVDGEADCSAGESCARDRCAINDLSGRLEVGDLIFIRVPALAFRKVASATLSWTNHVGVVTDPGARDPLIGESTFPLSRQTTLSRFVARSERGRVAVGRLRTPLDDAQRLAVVQEVGRRCGIFYDTGFNLHSQREFCSRFAREVLAGATGIEVGQVERFSTLLSRNPEESLLFWQLWYFGRIPWDRQTVTPASLLNCRHVEVLFDGPVDRVPTGHCRLARRVS